MSSGDMKWMCAGLLVVPIPAFTFTCITPSSSMYRLYCSALIFGGPMVAVDSVKASGVVCSIEASGAKGAVAWNWNWSGKTAQGHTFSVKMNGPVHDRD
jgi:hypothetical protein